MWIIEVGIIAHYWASLFKIHIQPAIETQQFNTAVRKFWIEPLCYTWIHGRFQLVNPLKLKQKRLFRKIEQILALKCRSVYQHLLVCCSLSVYIYMFQNLKFYHRTFSDYLAMLASISGTHFRGKVITSTSMRCSN